VTGKLMYIKKARLKLKVKGILELFKKILVTLA
jgi:hypothetical protein